MEVFYRDELVKLILGDCREVLSEMMENTIDLIFTDPPYELGFMGKSWDKAGVSFDPETWRLCLRVLKPGGYLLSFGGTRTFHRIACAIEDAGFEFRDTVMWFYGSGFPKSLDVSKAIDKMKGLERKIIGQKWAERYPNGPGGVGFHGGPGEYTQVGRGPEMETAPASEEAKQWEGWGTALKPAFEPILVFRKSLIGTVAENVLEWGTGALNIDVSKIINSSLDELKQEYLCLIKTLKKED